MSIGFLAELITAYQGRDADTYSIAERTARRTLDRTEHPRRRMTDLDGETTVARAPLGRLPGLLIVASATLGRMLRSYSGASRSVDAQRRCEVAAPPRRGGKDSAAAAAVPQRQRPQPLVHGPGAGRTRHLRDRRGDRPSRGWDTIDMVKHAARRPASTLLEQAAAAAHAAGRPVLGDQRTTGETLGDYPYEVGRLLLVLINVLPLVISSWCWPGWPNGSARPTGAGCSSMAAAASARS